MPVTNAHSITASNAKNRLVFAMVTSLFFFWGFVHNLDPVLIPHLRKSFQLTDLQSSLVDSAVYIAYFVMALPAGYIMRRYGYKAGIIIGLLLFGVGSVLFVPAANTLQYAFFLAALFIIASGLTFLETAANPYVTVLGPPETATRRLNFAQSFNGLAAFIAPAYIGPLILSVNRFSKEDTVGLSAQQLHAALQAEAASVKTPYLVLGLLILLVAIIFYFISMPDIREEGEASADSSFKAALHSANLRWGIVAQFFYVGAQVCVASFFIKMAVTTAGLTEPTAAMYLGYYGLAFMLGRFAGTFFMKYISPANLLAIYAAASILLTAVAITATGMLVLYTLIALAFFMSIMFPTIFSMGIQGLGAHTKTGSSLIIMSIVGGAVLAPLLGYISDITGSIQKGYLVPLGCFIVVLLFAVRKKNF
jgi:MFS transporter, FHS family, L-fucose permease